MNTSNPLFACLQLLLSDYEQTLAKIPEVLKRLSLPLNRRLDEAVEPALSSISWTSLNIDKFVQGIRAEMAECEQLIVRATEIIDYRIESVFREMTACELCRLPEDETWTAEQFIDQTEVCISPFFLCIFCFFVD